jgi:hypothetical protein
LLPKDKVFPKPTEVRDDVGSGMVAVQVGLVKVVAVVVLLILLLPSNKVFLKQKEAEEVLDSVSEDDFGSGEAVVTLVIPREEVEPKTWEVVLGCCILKENKNQ